MDIAIGGRARARASVDDIVWWQSKRCGAHRQGRIEFIRSSALKGITEGVVSRVNGDGQCGERGLAWSEGTIRGVVGNEITDRMT